MLCIKPEISKKNNSPALQPKLQIGQPGDKYEQEADAVADKVLRMPEIKPVQMQPLEEEEEMLQPKVRMQPLEEEEELLQPKIRLQPIEEEEEELMMKKGSGIQKSENKQSEASAKTTGLINKNRGGGQKISPQIEKEMSGKIGADFKDVNIHTNSDAHQMNQDLGAKAFTVGTDIYFNKGNYNPASSPGKHLLAHELTHVVQQNSQSGNIISREPIPETMAAESVTEVTEVPAAEKTDEVLADAIMDTQYAILDGWDTALDVFDKVLDSASDEETRPDFMNAMKSCLEDKLMGEIIALSKVPGAGDAFALLGTLTEEVKRASVARESANLRDFYNLHKVSIGTLKMDINLMKDDFKHKVVKTRKEMETAESISGHGGGEGAGATVANTPESDAYGLMRMHLVETLESLDRQAKVSTPEQLYTVLSEEWIQLGTVTGGLGMKFPAWVIIRLNEDHSVIDAHIQGTGGQKIAEQLLKFSPAGVDVFNLEAKRRITLHSGPGLPNAVLRLDENNRNVNEGSLIEGNWPSLQDYVFANGLPPTQNLTGD